VEDTEEKERTKFIIKRERTKFLLLLKEKEGRRIEKQVLQKAKAAIE